MPQFNLALGRATGLALPLTLVAVVDDNEAVRLSACLLLERAGFDIQLFESGDDFLADEASHAFACILLDMRMPGCDGLAVLLALRERGNSPPVIVITGHGDVAQAVSAMQLGAHDFIEKPYAPAVLLAAIAKAVVSRSTERVAATIRSEAEALVGTLSRRQRQILQLIVGGLQNKLIAYELGLSTRTVEAYRAQLLTKLGARGTADAVRVALAAGLQAAAARVLNLVLIIAAAGREMFQAPAVGTELNYLLIATV